ncbi:MAG: biopolymer transporter ExbD [Planctomycetaceae bacterium]|nr:biopolymer transporter ExbD [Planctomycetaceae bacterium]
MKRQESLFGRYRVRQQVEMDMMPMADMTFLLLIFFMVTASFAIQKSLEFPNADRQDDSTQNRTVGDVENRDDFIVVRIDGDNVYHVDDRETHSRQELLSILREIKNADAGRFGTPLRLLIIADNTAKHETVVSAIDVGNAAGITGIKYATVEE